MAGHAGQCGLAPVLCVEDAPQLVKGLQEPENHTQGDRKRSMRCVTRFGNSAFFGVRSQSVDRIGAG